MHHPGLSTLPPEAPLLADHPALDLLNTEAGSGTLYVDYWTCAGDVLHWLERCGIDAGMAADAGSKASLLGDARALRAAARELVERRKKGERGNPEPLNSYLAALQSIPVLEWDELADSAPRLLRRLPTPSPAQALGLLAESVASLLAEGDFDLVRQCEHPDCVLWFYDRTKSHRRRWCSMALCGNRHKAAEFRKRTRSGATA